MLDHKSNEFSKSFFTQLLLTFFQQGVCEETFRKFVTFTVQLEIDYANFKALETSVTELPQRSTFSTFPWSKITNSFMFEFSISKTPRIFCFLIMGKWRKSTVVEIPHVVLNPLWKFLEPKNIRPPVFWSFRSLKMERRFENPQKNWVDLYFWALGSSSHHNRSKVGFTSQGVPHGEYDVESIFQLT